jgi:hypothetical protein
MYFYVKESKENQIYFVNAFDELSEQPKKFDIILSPYQINDIPFFYSHLIKFT